MSGQTQSGSMANEGKTFIKVRLPVHSLPPSKASFFHSWQKRSWTRVGRACVRWTTLAKAWKRPLLCCFSAFSGPSEHLGEIHMLKGSYWVVRRCRGQLAGIPFVTTSSLLLKTLCKTKTLNDPVGLWAARISKHGLSLGWNGYEKLCRPAPCSSIRQRLVALVSQMAWTAWQQHHCFCWRAVTCLNPRGFQWHRPGG